VGFLSVPLDELGEQELGAGDSYRASSGEDMVGKRRWVQGRLWT
jgi:hypothetical protein